MRPSLAIAGQRAAADPKQSVWLIANAGSGKTSVLIDRVARLLLSGTRPEKILCLTYTKAAAGEMQNRLFARLGEWSILPDAALTEALSRLDPVQGAAGGPGLATARRLFAEAIDAPGGLKIQTIHSFCAGLLRRFPIEAGVAPGFRELDEFQAAQLRGMVAEEMALGSDVTLLDALVRRLDESAFARLLAEICGKRDAFAAPVTDDHIFGRFGLKPGASEDDVAAVIFDGREDALFEAIIPALLKGKKNSAKAWAVLRSVAAAPRDFAAAEALMSGFLTKEKGQPNKNIIAAGVRDALGDLAEETDNFLLRVADARSFLQRLEAARSTVALHRFAQSYLPRYAAVKLARGLIDFDDLIGRAGALLSDRSVAAWVLWRLDGGIEHILVDEAQDTSPAQWGLIARLSEEIIAGRGGQGQAGKAHRTIFVVGDAKQSIYSFQGADLQEFMSKEAYFRELLAPGSKLETLDLATSFRSSPAVLSVVDATFGHEEIAGLGGAKPRHSAHHDWLPGRADLWPTVPRPEMEDLADYGTALPTPFAPSAEFILADRIARTIRGHIDAGTRITLRDGTIRRMHEGDVLILVRGRGLLFSAIIRACKRRGLAVAGADRLTLSRELAVRDVLALLSVLALPEDDLSLAAALRSPLIGLSEDQLFRLAAPRAKGSYLWAELRGRAAEFPEAAAILQDLRDQTDFLRPYELIERILVRHHGRQRLIARLGTEAEDAIDELLAQALVYEQMDVPSLTGFLGHIQQSDIEVRREMSQASDALRVMTVHGAKGLEAPVVILPDTAVKRPRERERVVSDEDGLPLWKGNAAEQPGPVQSAVEEVKSRAEKESMRLLYVAMTRAQSWLIVCGIDSRGVGRSWHDSVTEGLKSAGGETVTGPDGDFLRLSYKEWPAEAGTATDGADTQIAGSILPDWVNTTLPPIRETVPRVLASGLPGPKVLPGPRGTEIDGEASRLYGTRLHRLLEHLPLWPEQEWPEIALQLLSGGIEAVDAGEAARVLSDAQRLLATPSLAGIFDRNSFAEVPVAGEVAAFGGVRAYAVIDRLVIGADSVLAVDFKSNREVPGRPEDVPAGLLRQMGLTADLLGQAFPGRRIETAILWAVTATLMPLPPDIVRSALQSTPSLDAAGVGP
jgi:ATP-dependent helicase/nuclease subunit A